MSMIRDWLAGIGLDQYAEAFEREQIDPESARYLTEVNLKELGMPMGPRAKFLAAVKLLDSVSGSQSLTPGSNGSAAPSSSTRGAERRQLTVLSAIWSARLSFLTASDPSHTGSWYRATRRPAPRPLPVMTVM